MPLTSHQAHDAGALTRQWRRAVRRSGWELTVLDDIAGLPVLALRTRSTAPDGLYLSTGVHGDEPAPPWALLQWFEVHGRRLANHPISILPCLNPLGLVANTRVDHRGEDLNRQFHRPEHPLIAAWRTWLGPRRFQLALCLHEDYDGQGIYCYELYHRGGASLAESLLGACQEIIPRDQRRRIDGRRAIRGVIRRSRMPRDLPGLPEAIGLHRHYAAHNLTFESPSEFSLIDRMRAQQCFIEAAVASLGWSAMG